jgi:hypothetical protein
MQHTVGRRSSQSPSSSAGPHAPPLRLCVWGCAHGVAAKLPSEAIRAAAGVARATHTAGGSVLAAARKSTADSAVERWQRRASRRSRTGPSRGAPGSGTVDLARPPSLRPERSPRASSGTVTATPTRGTRGGGPERGQAVRRRRSGPRIWHTHPPSAPSAVRGRAAAPSRLRRHAAPAPPPPPLLCPHAGGALTQQHALDHGAVLQLHRHRLVRQLHQKPAHDTGGQGYASQRQRKRAFVAPTTTPGVARGVGNACTGA